MNKELVQNERKNLHLKQSDATSDLYISLEELEDWIYKHESELGKDAFAKLDEWINSHKGLLGAVTTLNYQTQMDDYELHALIKGRGKWDCYVCERSGTTHGGLKCINCNGSGTIVLREYNKICPCCGADVDYKDEDISPSHPNVYNLSGVPQYVCDDCKGTVIPF